MDIYDRMDFAQDRLTPREERQERKKDNELIHHYEGISASDGRD